MNYRIKSQEGGRWRQQVCLDELQPLASHPQTATQNNTVTKEHSTYSTRAALLAHRLERGLTNNRGSSANRQAGAGQANLAVVLPSAPFLW